MAGDTRRCCCTPCDYPNLWSLSVSFSGFPGYLEYGDWSPGGPNTPWPLDIPFYNDLRKSMSDLLDGTYNYYPQCGEYVGTETYECPRNNRSRIVRYNYITDLKLIAEAIPTYCGDPSQAPPEWEDRKSRLTKRIYSYSKAQIVVPIDLDASKCPGCWNACNVKTFGQMALRFFIRIIYPRQLWYVYECNDLIKYPEQNCIDVNVFGDNDYPYYLDFVVGENVGLYYCDQSPYYPYPYTCYPNQTFKFGIPYYDGFCSTGPSYRYDCSQPPAGVWPDLRLTGAGDGTEKVSVTIGWNRIV